MNQRPGLPIPKEVVPWDSQSPPPTGKPRRSWPDKFRDAFRGVKLGIRGHSSFFVHFFFAALAVAAGVVLHCDHYEWCLLIGCIGLVLTAELFNSALENLFRAFDPLTRDRHFACLDISAGSVLLASGTAFLIGAIVFLRRLALVLGLV